MQNDKRNFFVKHKKRKPIFPRQITSPVSINFIQLGQQQNDNQKLGHSVSAKSLSNA